MEPDAREDAPAPRQRGKRATDGPRPSTGSKPVRGKCAAAVPARPRPKPAQPGASDTSPAPPARTSRAAKSTASRSRPRRLAPPQVHELFSRLRELDPHPTTELEYSTPFELLVAVILSAQATDVGVNKATRRLYPVANTPEAILALGEDGLKKHIATIGLFNAKARNVIATCALLVDRHGGQVPRQREALEALPGVGRKTANVVLNTAFGEPTMAVDTHIFRVANRTGLAPGKDVRAVEDGLLDTVPAQFLHDAHHWLILHGRYVCKARKPDCPQCVIRDLCLFPDKTEGSAG